MGIIGVIKKKLLRSNKKWHDPDNILIFVTGIIIIFGLVMLSSASSVIAYTKFGSSYHFFNKQLLGLIVGIVSFVIVLNIDYHLWKKYAFHLLIFSILLLTIVFVPGIGAEHGTSRSWINIFGFSLQPSEFVKVSFLIYLVAWLEVKRKSLTNFSQGFGPFVVILGVISLLMILQPDMGTLFIILSTSLIVYFVGGGSIRHIIIFLAVSVIASMFLLSTQSYQLDRFKCMQDPGYSSNDACYQINQSLIAVGSGGIIGRGLGQSRQKFMYLPEVYGDSIFAIISEEVGFIFNVALLFLYFTIFYRGYLISKNAPDLFGKILAIGIVIQIFIQTIVNISGMINLMPITGVTLPLISYGGSSMWATLIAIGILANISRQTKFSKI